MNESKIESDVLVLGGGFAGVWCARGLSRSASVTLVSNENYFTFQPLLPEVVGASLEPSHVVSPLRQLLPGVRILRAEITEFLDDGCTVELRVPGMDAPLRCRGRHAVLALGSVVDVSRIPGMAEHAFLMKSLADALRLRHALVERLERAVITPSEEERSALLTFVVVGGGFSGVETAAEILDLLRHAQSFYPSLRKEQIRVVCVHSGDQLIPEIDRRLGAFAKRKLQDRGMDIRMGKRVRAVSNETVYLDDGERISTRTVVCTVGNAPHPALDALDCERDRGRVVTDAQLRVVGRENLWAIGDCASTPDGHGGGSKPTAQFATRQGGVAADNILRVLRGKSPRPFRHRNLGQLATLGHRQAVALIGGLRISGFLAWWLWRTVYLMKLPRLHRKLQVVADWTLNLFFPRNLNVLDLKSTESMRRVHLEEGEELFRQGDPSSAFYILESGEIELIRIDDEGKIEVSEVLRPGDHFGEGSLLGGKRRLSTARACSASTVSVLGGDLFDDMAGQWRLMRDALDGTARRFHAREEVLPRAVPESVLQQPCRTVMTSPPITVDAGATVADVLEVLTSHSIGCVPLVDLDGRPSGLMTRTDVYRAMQRDIDLSAPAANLGSSRPRTVRSDTPVSRAVELLQRHGVKHLPVCDLDGRLVGVLSFRDVLRAALRQRVAEGRDAVGAEQVALEG